MIREGKAKLVIPAHHSLAVRKSEIVCYALLAKTGVPHYRGHDIEWDARVKNVIIDPGDFDIIRSIPEQTGEK